MRILLASSEVHPFSKTGGLGDMTGSLGKALARAGHEVGLVTPLYRGIAGRFPALRRLDYRIDLPLAVRWYHAGVLALDWVRGLTVYFIEQPEFFDRPGIYNEDQVDYGDNADRFIFFSKCVAHLARYLPLQPEVVHVHDWQTGLVPLFVLHQREREGWRDAPRVCFTIHNLAYQGLFGRGAYPLTSLPDDYFHPDQAEFYGGLNCLKTGITCADVITTVSPRYAREILTEAFGCDLDGVLRRRQRDLVGILNGADYSEWNTTENPYLKHPYSAGDLDGKTSEKRDLQSDLGLASAVDVPLFGNVSRLVEQKGSDLLLGALEEMLSTRMQFVLLGSGSAWLERAFHRLALRHPGKVAVRTGYDHALAHRIEAGADFFLMPSRFEPCGLNQMYSLRYGTPPVVRATGGLDDSVVDLTENAQMATGIKFREPTTRALAKAIRKALVLYERKPLLELIRRNGIAQDFSWERTAGEYAEVYRRVAQGTSRR